MTARFALKVDDNNGHHVRFRVYIYAATGGQHLGQCGALTMRADEYEAFRQLLEPALTDRPAPYSFDDFEEIRNEQAARRAEDEAIQ